jgi:hypothetical protein
MAKAESRSFILTTGSMAGIRAYHEKLPKDGTWQLTYAPVTKDRSGKQNRLSWLWYGELAKANGTSPEYEHNFCKLRYGCPILIAASEEFSRVYHDIIAPLPYMKKLEAMEFIDVTSIMNITQMTEYLNTIERENAGRGIHLSQPEDVYYEAMGLRRHK